MALISFKECRMFQNFLIGTLYGMEIISISKLFSGPCIFPDSTSTENSVSVVQDLFFTLFNVLHMC